MDVIQVDSVCLDYDNSLRAPSKSGCYLVTSIYSVTPDWLPAEQSCKHSGVRNFFSRAEGCLGDMPPFRYLPMSGSHRLISAVSVILVNNISLTCLHHTNSTLTIVSLEYTCLLLNINSICYNDLTRYMSK